MTNHVKTLFEEARKLSAAEREELAELLLDTLPETADAATLAALDEALAEGRRGEAADPAEVEAFFAKFRT